MWREHDLPADHYIPNMLIPPAPHTTDKLIKLTYEYPLQASRYAPRVSTNLRVVSSRCQSLLLTVWRPVCDCACGALCQQWIFVTLDLNAAAANPKTFSCSGQGRSRRVAGAVVLGQLLNGWRITIGLENLLSVWSLLQSAFFQLTVSKAECTLFVYGCPAGGARQGWPLVQGLLVGPGAGCSKDRAACLLASTHTLSKAPLLASEVDYRPFLASSNSTNLTS